jgi:hypothetical protein
MSPIFVLQADDTAWVVFQRGLTALNETGDRALAMHHWNLVLTAFPNSRYESQCQDYVRVLAQMLAEDSAFRELEGVKAHPVHEQIEYWIYKLREVNAVQRSQPGHCHLLEGYVFRRDKSNAAHQLAGFGKAAVPALIGLLEDERLTRSYGFHRTFSPWRWVLRYQDAAVQILGAIANESFYVPRTTSSYFSNEDPAVRQSVAAKIRDWWHKNESRTETAWLKEALVKNGIGDSSRNIIAARRIIEIDGASAVPFFRERIAAEPENPWAVKMLREAGDSAMVDE